MRELRCEKDGKLLLRACLVDGDLEIKCRACGHINTFSAHETDMKFMCYRYPCEGRVDQHGNMMSQPMDSDKEPK